jgi:hypothetical protein
MDRIDSNRRGRARYHLGAMITTAFAFLGISSWLWTEDWWNVVPWLLVIFLTLLGEVSKLLTYRSGYHAGVIDAQRTLMQMKPLFADDPHPADRYVGEP